MVELFVYYNKYICHAPVKCYTFITKNCFKQVQSTFSTMSFPDRSLIEEIPSLTNKFVHIKDRCRVEQILNDLVSGGAEKLQIITDFDRTLTLPYTNGVPTMSSFGIFHTCASLPIDYIRQADDLFHFYRPLEIDPQISTKVKSQLMEEWTQREADLLDFELDRSEIAVAVAKADVELRAGTDIMFRRLHEHKVPALVFSAGLGDIVLGVLEYKKVMHNNMHVISNYLKYNGKRLCGLQGSIIHTFNKNEHAVVNTPYFNELQNKENVILMGDTVGDAGMSEGVPNLKSVLKIGFLDNQIDASLPSFMDAFDIVLVRDPTINLVNELLDKILR